jgi:hypothetical protein
MGLSAETREIWAWPGPAYLYEWLIVVAFMLPLLHVFGMADFAMSVVTALIICVSYLLALFRTDLSTKDWHKFNHGTVWIMRTAALGVGFWLFSATPGNASRFVAVFVYAVLYVISENMVWRRKRAVLATE